MSAENKKPFYAISGIGIILIGISLLVTGIVIGVTDSVWSFIVFARGFVIGLAMLIYAGLRYN